MTTKNENFDCLKLRSGKLEMSKSLTFAICRPRCSRFEGKKCLEHARNEKTTYFYKSTQLSCNTSQREPKTPPKRRFHVIFSVVMPI